MHRNACLIPIIIFNQIRFISLSPFTWQHEVHTETDHYLKKVFGHVWSKGRKDEHESGIYYFFTNTVDIIRIHQECEGAQGGIEKSAPRITVCHQEACRLMTNSDHERWIWFIPPSHK